MSLVSLQNLLKRRPWSASCASNPPVCCFLEAIAGAAYIPWATLWSPLLYIVQMVFSDNGADKMFLFLLEISYSYTKVPIIYKHSPGVAFIHENKNKINNQVTETQ